MKKPLNGTKTHPLTQASIEVLRDIARQGFVPRQKLNPGVYDRLDRENLIETAPLPSPYKTHKGKWIDHVGITEAGRLALRTPPTDPEGAK